MNEKTSLEKSHAVGNNILLVLLCILATLSVSAIWISLALVTRLKTGIFLLILIPAILLTALSIYLFRIFKR